MTQSGKRESWEKVKEIEENLWSFDPIVGLISLVAYFGVGMVLPGLISKDFYSRYGFIRYLIVMMSLLLMYFVPIKIFLRLVFNIKYVLVTPWFNI